MIKSLFNDNAIYGISDINNIFTHLTTGGIVSVSDDVVTAALESGVAQTTTGGIEFHNPEACRLTKSDSGYMVLDGSAFMPDGSIVTVSGGGETVSGIVSGKTNYIFFQRSSETNGTQIVVSETLPDATDSVVMIASVDASGEIVDKRVYATTKLIPSTGNIYPVRDIGICVQSDGSAQGKTYKLAEENIGWNAYQYIRVLYQYYNKNGEHVLENDELRWYDISSGTTGEVSTSTYGNGAKFEFIKNGGILEVYQTWCADKTLYGYDGILQITFF